MDKIIEIIQILSSTEVPGWRVLLLTLVPVWLLWLILNFFLQVIHKSIRANTIRKAGYPPTHCDGDGDMAEEAGTVDDKGISPL